MTKNLFLIDYMYKYISQLAIERRCIEIRSCSFLFVRSCLINLYLTLYIIFTIHSQINVLFFLFVNIVNVNIVNVNIVM